MQQQPEEQQPLIPGAPEPVDLNLTVFQTLSKIYMLLRGVQLAEPEVFNQRREEEAIQKALLEYKLTLPKDEKVARNFLINFLRDVVGGIFGALVIAYLRKDENAISIANILTIALPVCIAGLVIIRETYDARNEFIQNEGARRKTILDAQAHHKKAEGLENKLQEKEAKLSQAEKELKAANVVIEKLTAQIDKLSEEIRELKEEKRQDLTTLKENVGFLKERVPQQLNENREVYSSLVTTLKNDIAKVENVLAPIPKQLDSIEQKIK